MDKDRSEPAKTAVAGQLERGVRPHSQAMLLERGVAHPEPAQP